MSYNIGHQVPRAEDKPINKIFSTFLFLIVLLSVVVGIALAQGGENNPTRRIVLTDQEGQYPLGLHLEILEDPSGQLTIDQVASPEMDSRFYPSSEEIPHFGITRSTIWIRFRVEDISNNIPNWLLQVRHATLDYVDLFLPDTAGGYRTYTSGLLVPDAQQDFPDNHYVFRDSGWSSARPVHLLTHCDNQLDDPACHALVSIRL